MRRAAAADRVIDTCKFEQRFDVGSSNPPFNDCRKLSVNMSARGVAYKELLIRPPLVNVAFKTIHTYTYLPYNRSDRRTLNYICLASFHYWILKFNVNKDLSHVNKVAYFMFSIEFDRCDTTRGASGHCIISIANFDKLPVLDAIRKYKRLVCKFLVRRTAFTWFVECQHQVTSFLPFHNVISKKNETLKV